MNVVSTQASLSQARASRPDVSAWVSANAGSGKTYVLVNRIIRLLLSGAPPARIMCLTFTRAAAAEMEARLFRRLSAWILLNDVELREALGKLDGADGWSGNLDVARRLFTRALETPGGLKIQTLHGFCESVLQRFPVEAGLAPGFTIIDERGSSGLMREAREDVLGLAALDAPISDDAKALKEIVVHTQAAGFDDVLGVLLDERSPWVVSWAPGKAGDDLRRVLYGELGLQMGDTPESVVGLACEEISRDDVEAAYSAFLTGKSKTDQERAETSGELLKQPDWEAYCGLFLTAKGEARSERSLATKAIKDNFPIVWDWLQREQNRVLAAEDRRKAALTAKASNALFTLASIILRRFQTEKERRGLLDYDDLVLYTKNLLTRLDSNWVLWRLDGGIDHVLIDEAQDTSPDQWAIVNQLTSEFYSGEGARDILRTLFVVGDHKQSIFSFQGAEPARFIEEKANLAKRVTAAKQTFEDVRINISFRSTQRVLDLVDNVFRDPLAQKGMADDEIDHQVNRLGQAGLVEMWPLSEKEAEEERDPYDPVDRPGISDPRLRLASHIAETVKGWLDTGERLTPRDRAVVPGDILVLVRNRTVLADALVRALRERDVPVAGADRLKINSHIAIMDLVALARAMHLPQDDYSLACILKSPLVCREDGLSLDDDDLIELAASRTGTLWQALAGSEKFSHIAEQLGTWRRQARHSRPLEFFMSVLETCGARKRFAGRMGSEVHDPLDEFLALAADYERLHAPVLHGFIGWLTDADSQIKRDMDHGRNEVRVMTVHGAKGLESNIVILPDTTRLPDARKVSRILTFESGLPVWKLAAASLPAAVSALVAEDIAKQNEEENRLLYVALTRARDRLYVCGAEGRRGELPPQCWYELIRRALEPVASDAGDGILRWDAEQTAEPLDDEESTAEAARPVEPESWMLQPAPAEPLEPKPLAPSRLDLIETAEGKAAQLQEQAAASPVAEPGQNRFLRGQLIHRLLQSLPALSEQDRPEAARRFLAAYAEEPGAENLPSVAQDVFNLLEATDPALKTLFGPAGLAEVPITGKLDLVHESGAPVVISGNIDRLAVTDREVLIADFKTNRPPPDKVADVAHVYIRQLSAYARVLQTVCPGKPVRAWLVWTHTGRAMEVPEEMLADAFT